MNAGCVFVILILTTEVAYTSGMSKRMTYGKIYRPDVRAHPRLSHGCIFTRRQVFTFRADGKKKRPCGRANTSARTRSCIRVDTSASGRTRPCVRVDIGASVQK
jgi:hypothetical protein